MTASPASISSYIDQTILKPDAVLADIDAFVAGFMKYPFYCACANSCWINYLRPRLPAASKICSVAGFPLGASSTAIKVREIEELVRIGCDEIDMVINVGKLKGGDYRYVEDELCSAASAAGGKILKVIIETCLLTDREKVTAARLVKNSPAHFVKTSTGFAHAGANVRDVSLLRSTVGPDFGIKASGGIRTYSSARALIDAGATRIGTSAGVAIMDEAVDLTERAR